MDIFRSFAVSVTVRSDLSLSDNDDSSPKAGRVLTRLSQLNFANPDSIREDIRWATSYRTQMAFSYQSRFAHSRYVVACSHSEVE
jgi:hypothetical protein